MSSQTLERQAKEIANANYEVLKEEVLRAVAGKLRSESITTMNRADLEDAYQQGWQGVCQHIIRGGPLTSLDGLLYRIVLRRAQDIYRQKSEARYVDLDLEQQTVEVDIAGRLDDHGKLNQLLGRLKNRLNDNERKAVTLCVLHGYQRPEAAKMLGIDRVVFERIMDGATRKMSGVIASLDARGCGDGEWTRALRAYALGALEEDERDYQRVRAHIEGDEPCLRCRRYVRGLQGLAAILPPLLPGLPASGNESDILAHLYKLFGSGHGAAAGASVALQGSTAGSVGIASGNGGTLSALLGSGAAKTAVVLGVAAASAVGVRSAVIGTRHHSDRQTSVSSAPFRATAGLLTDQGTSFAGALLEHRHATSSSRRHQHAHRTAARKRYHGAKGTTPTGAPSEFGFESPPATITKPKTASPKVVTHSAASGTEGSEAGGEFGFE
jgi:DNA-directed RNA polymerase specialized sigma24 family protein